MIRRRSLLLLLLILALFGAGTAWLAQVRPIDGDEGYYATAARLTASGQTPYADYFYPQMPYLPYLYGPLQGVVGPSLTGLRLGSVAALVLTLGLWGALLVARVGDRPMFVVGGLLLLALNPHLLSWGVTTKTFALANLGVVGALWAADRGLATRKLVWFLVSGLAAALAVGVRLLYAPWAVALLGGLAWLRWRRPATGITPASVAAAGVGLLLGLVPALRLYLADPERFVFNNLIYHRLRFNPLDRLVAEGEAPDVPRFLAALLELARALLLNPSLLVLIGLAVVGVRAARRPGAHDHSDTELRPVALLAGWGAVVLALTCLLPDPSYEQYFTAPLVPLLVPAALLGLIDLARRFGRPTTLVGGVLGALAVIAAVGLQVRHVGMDWNEVWDPARVREVAREIRQRSARDDVVLSFWSGYPFAADRPFLPGMENHFALGVSEQLTPAQQAHYHVAGKEALLHAILTKGPAVIVLGTWMHEVNTTIAQEHLPVLLQELDANYRIDWYRGEVKVLVRKPGPGAKLR
ncbi:hypothetical protein KDM41_13790 [bacterium]|nr:hypothetical protein [bacterium]